jgi:hypothetical protein
VLLLGALGGCGRFGFGSAGTGDAHADDGDGDSELPIDDDAATGPALVACTETRVTNTAGSERATALVATTSELVAQWVAGAAPTASISMTRLGFDATPIGNTAFVAGDVLEPELAWSGSELGLVYSKPASNNYEVHFDAYSPAGVLQGAELQVTGSPSQVDRRANLIRRGNEWAITFRNTVSPSHLYITRVAGGALVAGSELLVSAADRHSVAAITLDDMGYAVAWTNRITNTTTNETWFTQLLPDGSKRGGDFKVTPTGVLEAMPSIVWSGSEYGLAWTDSRAGVDEVYFARFTAIGTRSGPELRLSGANSDSPSLVSDGTGYAIAWADGRDGAQDIFLSLLDASGARRGGDVRVTNLPGASTAPHVVLLPGGGYAIAWTDARAGTGEEDVYLAICH